MKKNLSESILIELSNNIPDSLVNLSKLAGEISPRKMHDGNYKFSIDNKNYVYYTKLDKFGKYDKFYQKSGNYYDLEYLYFNIIKDTHIDLQQGNKTVESIPLSEIRKVDKETGKYELIINDVRLILYLPKEIPNEFGIFTNPTYNKQTENIDYFLN